MRQYHDQKRLAPDALLFFRMGDFYETFFDDAKTASRVLGIALTTRSKDKDPVPLAGIPYHALESYLRKLVAAGIKVAICEQVEDPKLAKGVVKREIVRIVTAGTLTDDALLDDRRDNLLAAMVAGRNGIGLAVVELASGRFRAFNELADGVLDELVRLRPAEVLIDDEPDSPIAVIAKELVGLCATVVTHRAALEFTEHHAVRVLHGQFGVRTMEGFGFERVDASVRAAGAIVHYLAETQKTALSHLRRLEPHRPSDTLRIDRNTWRALEIERTVRGGQREGSLLHAIDRTVQVMGARRLADWLANPLVDVSAIVARQDAVAALVEDDRARRGLRERLKSCNDVERIAARVALGRANPRDLVGLGRTLGALPDIRSVLEPLGPPALRQWREELAGLDELAGLLQRALRADAPPVVREGGVIADGYHAELDELRSIRRDGRAWLADYQKRQIEETGIPSLKIAYNRVFGFYIEVTHTHRDRVPSHYVRKQTVTNAERYITDELKTYEHKVLNAEEQAVAMETRLFDDLRLETARHVPTLQRVADALGRLDCVAGFAELAVERRYVRPEVNDGTSLRIVEGRHPVLDQTLSDRFVPNDVDLNDHQRVWIITGPNMSGKSTFMRQVALLSLLAQTGSYVPAAEMSLGVIDRLFARVGASDDITQNKSTFMVEMTEAAVILNHATPRSLVVLDEIGRGTSTYDGLSLCRAITEYLAATTRARSLVATHYHELTALAEHFPTVANHNVSVREWPDAAIDADRIIFLHRIVPGACDRSYGLHVAKMAGVPDAVVKRAAQVLGELENQMHGRSVDRRKSPGSAPPGPQLSLFDGGNHASNALIDGVRAIDLDCTSPIEALMELRRLQKLAQEARSPG
ncbi:MAG: DNA mismatch repair protein MutS [Phycisphaerales bacterium]|nr:DNA mismatch repair protein MutS [Phycisphaerales bacterium]